MDGTEKKAKKSVFRKWWFWLIVVIVAIVIISNSGKDDKEAAGDRSTGQSMEDEAAPTPKQEEKIITKAGDSITTKNFIVTVESFNKLPGDQFNKPDEGNEFWEIVMVIENKSDKEYSVSSIMMFEAYQDGYSVNESLSAQIANKSTSTMDGGLAAGKKLRGALAYELPGTWEELEVHVDLTALSFSTDGELKIVLQNE